MKSTTSMDIRPMLASDYKPEKLKFPVAVLPKIDGVRALNLDGKLVARSRKKHANIHVTTQFSQPEFDGFDGEMAVEHECHPRLCSLTSSAMRTISGEPEIVWHLFDYALGHLRQYTYLERYQLLCRRVAALKEAGKGQYLNIVPLVMCQSLEEVQAQHEKWLDEGYEGTILRDPNGIYKEGRSTVREGGFLRIKDFIEEEAIVVSIVEGRKNANPAMINELGYTYRETHQGNMVPNGQVGALKCTILKTSDLFKEGDEIMVGPGVMTHAERIVYFEEQEALVGQIIKFKHFPKGVKDKPRFPQFTSIRSKEDM